MSEAKTYVFGNEGNGMLGLLAPLFQLRGLDPNMVMAMMNNRGGNWGGEGGWFIWIIFLFFLMGWNRNGWGNNGGEGSYPLANMLNNDTGRELLMSAIQGNATAISQLATTLNCDVNSIQSAIQGVSAQLCQVGNLVGLTSQQVINAIQQGNMTIAQLLSSCCCDIREAITRSNYDNQLANERQTYALTNSINSVSTGLERGFSSTAFETAQQTCALQNTIKDSGTTNTNAIIAKLDAMQTLALLDKITALREKNSEQAVIINNAQLSALFGQMIGQATAPISASIAGLTKEVADIQCKLPLTVTLPYSCATAVPTCLASQYGLYGNGFYGTWG